MADEHSSGHEPDIKARAKSWIQASKTTRTRQPADNDGLSLYQYLIELNPTDAHLALFRAEVSELARRLRHDEAIDQERQEWRDRVTPYPRIVQLISAALPITPDRDQCARACADAIALASIAVRNGASRLGINRNRRARQESRNEKAALVSESARLFLHEAASFPEFIAALKKTASSQGLSFTEIGLISFMEAIETTARRLEQPAPVDPKIDRKTATPESEFDALASFILAPRLTIPERARLIVQLRALLGMAEASEKVIERRLYNLEARS
jgi:hypothetical protein